MCRGGIVYAEEEVCDAKYIAVLGHKPRGTSIFIRFQRSTSV